MVRVAIRSAGAVVTATVVVALHDISDHLWMQAGDERGRVAYLAVRAGAGDGVAAGAGASRSRARGAALGHDCGN